MAIDFNIPSRGLPLTNRLVDRYNITPEDKDETKYQSYLGTPVYSPLEFLRTSGTSLDNSLNVGGSIGDNDVLLRVDTVLITVNQVKNIVKTPIAGRNGTVKEYISDGDFIIDIRGAIVSEYPLVFPRFQVDLLIELLSLQKQIPVACEFLSFFGIDKETPGVASIVVESYTVSQKLGSRNEVPFEIQAISDLPEEIVLNPNVNI
jgi:hypothetical protein